MKKIFRKAITVLGSAALIGATVGAAAAAAYPGPFTSSNTAVVYGSGAASTLSEMNAVSDIQDNINGGFKMEYVYAALMLHSAGKAVDESSVKKIIDN